jgi:hypothetical protein
MKNLLLFKNIKMSLTATYFDNINFFNCILPKESMDIFTEEASYIENNFDSIETSNHTLAGNIAREYQLESESIQKIEHILLPYAKSYIENNKFLFGTSIDYLKLRLKSAWINFQAKHEFNPPHNHTGIISFVVWVKIPYSSFEERISKSVKHSNAPLAGSFQFLYTDALGRICQHNIHCDNSMENTLLMFPAPLKHAVYPFYTSEDYRITISGNFFLE